jgi:hypothetical protein
LLETAGPQNVLSINYHTEIPFPGDPMYLASKEGNDARIEIYNVCSNPIAFIDGVISESGTSDLESRLNAGISKRASVSPLATLEVENFKKNPTNVSGEIQINALENFSASLFIAVLENTINYDQPPGHNGQKHFFDVFRAFHSSPTGNLITMIAKEKQRHAFNFVVDEQWNYSQLKVVVFLQTADKQVLQAASSVYP